MRRYAAFLGATVYLVVQEYAAQLDASLWMIVVGGLLMFTVLFLQGGLASLPAALRCWSAAVLARAGSR